jgi:hypothetical protein
MAAFRSGQHPLHHAGADGNLPADLTELVDSFFHRGLNPLAPQLGALSLGSCQTSVDALPNGCPAQTKRIVQRIYKFANPAAADDWFEENDPQGVAFEYEVLE